MTAPSDLPTVSVVIPTYNRASMVKRCVASVLAIKDVNLECIVVDDHSPDDTGNVLHEAFSSDSRFRYHRNEKNLQLAGTHNVGARLARGELLFFLDDDNILEPKAIFHLVHAFSADAQLGLVAPVAIHQLSDGSRRVWTLGSDFHPWTSQPKDFMPGCLEKDIPDEPELLPTTYSPNAYMVRRAAYDSVGGFSDEFEIMYDESDFGWRLRRRHWKCAICTKARTTHFGFVENGDKARLRKLGIEKPRRTWLFARNRIWFVRRHFPLSRRLSVIFVFAPLSAAWYGAVAVRSGRPDIAWAYFRGMIRGVFSRLPPPPTPLVRENG